MFKMDRNISNFIILMLCFYSPFQFGNAIQEERTNNLELTEKSHDRQEEEEVARTFRSGQVTVHVVPNFLPHDLAVKWRDIMSQEWDACFQSDGTEEGSCSSDYDRHLGWQYATNNDGEFKGAYNSNAKVRSLDNIVARNETAQKMKRENLFSYSKWELHHDHPLVKEMEQTFLSKNIIDKVQNILSESTKGDIDLDSEELSDLFVTLYSTGDFLSTHNDGVSGTFAFVLSLMEGPKAKNGDQWKDGFGGTLQFQCENRGWCEELKPSFNTAVLFQTRDRYGGIGPMHEVLPVSLQAEVEGFRRFGLTGWYMDRKDIMSDGTRAERNKMRAK